jgi:hypothetical protein
MSSNPRHLISLGKAISLFRIPKGCQSSVRLSDIPGLGTQAALWGRLDSRHPVVASTSKLVSDQIPGVGVMSRQYEQIAADVQKPAEKC